MKLSPLVGGFLIQQSQPISEDQPSTPMEMETQTRPVEAQSMVNTWNLITLILKVETTIPNSSRFSQELSLELRSQWPRLETWLRLISLVSLLYQGRLEMTLGWLKVRYSSRLIAIQSCQDSTRGSALRASLLRSQIWPRLSTFKASTQLLLLRLLARTVKVNRISALAWSNLYKEDSHGLPSLKQITSRL